MAETVNNLSFDDGFQRVTINNDPERVIKWNPTDVGFIDRFLAFQNWAEAELPHLVKALNLDSATSFEEYKVGSASALGDEINTRINEVFVSDVSTVVFGGVHPLSPVPNGRLLYMSFLEALMPVIQGSVKNFDDARKKYTSAAKKVSANKSTIPAPAK